MNSYGFITGGVLPIAEVADNIVTAWDQNVQVHLPNCSIATNVEDRALEWLDQLINLSSPGRQFSGRIFTTGATASNILGLTCGRESVIAKQLEVKGLDPIKYGVSSLGLLGACRAAGIDDIQILTTLGHSSLYKAASVAGIGRSNVVDIGDAVEPWKFNMSSLREHLKKPNIASIVALSWGEVNTGRFSTNGLAEMQSIRALCDRYYAWLHIDAAFGFANPYLPDTPNGEFSFLKHCASGLELADSITGDAHKLLNVPYDCGFYFTRSLDILTRICSNGNAAYLLSAATSGPSEGGAAAKSIPSPLNIGLENSRRFRALPVYSVLYSKGRKGLQDMYVSQVRLARSIALFVHEHDAYTLLPSSGHGNPGPKDHVQKEIGIVVLFSAKDDAKNEGLVDRINAGGEMYVTGTSWNGRKAVRLAVSTWRVDSSRDLSLVSRILSAAVE